MISPHDFFFTWLFRLFCSFFFSFVQGLTREEAYKRVEKALHKERMGDVQMARSLVREASALSGGRPSFVSDEGVYDGLRQWQAILRETP